MEDNQFEIRSEEIQDIIGQVPHWIIRWGITVIMLVFFLTLLVGQFTSASGKVEVPAELLALEQPYQLSWQTSLPPGHVTSLYVRSGQHVRSGDTLLVETQNLKLGSKTILAPFDGIATLVRGSTQTTIWVSPQQSEYHVTLQLPHEVIGAIDTGQQVLIRLDKYAEGQNGFLEGYITSVNLQQDSTHRWATAALCQNLRSTTGKLFPVQPSYSATARLYGSKKESILGKIFHLNP